jgi:hypothetical protein
MGLNPNNMDDAETLKLMHKVMPIIQLNYQNESSVIAFFQILS